MAVTLGPVPRYQWQGLSSDTKPTDARVGVNDLFFETNTGKVYIYNGAWNVYSAVGSAGNTTVVVPSGDVTGATDGLAIMAAYNALPATAGGSIILAAGKYYFPSSQIIFSTSRVTLIGQGKGGDDNIGPPGAQTQLICIDGNGPAITCTCPAYKFQDFRLTCTGTSFSWLSAGIQMGQNSTSSTASPEFWEHDSIVVEGFVRNFSVATGPFGKISGCVYQTPGIYNIRWDNLYSFDGGDSFITNTLLTSNAVSQRLCDIYLGSVGGVYADSNKFLAGSALFGIYGQSTFPYTPHPNVPAAMVTSYTNANPGVFTAQNYFQNGDVISFYCPNGDAVGNQSLVPALRTIGTVSSASATALAGNSTFTTGISTAGNGSLYNFYRLGLSTSTLWAYKTQPITNITKAASAVITYSGTPLVPLVVGNYVYICGITSGMTQINNMQAKITAVGAGTITVNINSTGFGTWSAQTNAQVYQVYGTDINSLTTSTNTDIIIADNSFESGVVSPIMTEGAFALFTFTGNECYAQTFAGFSNAWSVNFLNNATVGYPTISNNNFSGYAGIHIVGIGGPGAIGPNLHSNVTGAAVINGSTVLNSPVSLEMNNPLGASAMQLSLQPQINAMSAGNTALLFNDSSIDLSRSTAGAVPTNTLRSMVHDYSVALVPALTIQGSTSQCVLSIGPPQHGAVQIDCTMAGTLAGTAVSFLLKFSRIISRETGAPVAIVTGTDQYFQNGAAVSITSSAGNFISITNGVYMQINYTTLSSSWASLNVAQIITNSLVTGQSLTGVFNVRATGNVTFLSIGGF